MHVNSAGLGCQYVIDNDSTDTHLLAKFVFDAQCIASASDGYISTGLPLLEGTGTHEMMSANASVRYDQTNEYYCAETEHYLLIAYWANEEAQGGLQQATETLYNQIFTQMQARGYAYLVRVWNYFSDINRIDQGLERYRQFCIGRYDAFVAQDIAEDQFPSACALGHKGGDLLVYALASKQAPQHFENPQQASAYHYPSEYGPRSPSFARASLIEIDSSSSLLFVSGTASVIGFVTQHPYDLAGQIAVTLENLACLADHVVMKQANKQSGKLPVIKADILKVYVRHEADLDEIKHQVTQAFPTTPAIYLAADICRDDLLLEIDGIWTLRNL